MSTEHDRPKATLEFFDPETGTRSIPVTKTIFSIGRHRENDLKVVDNFVSRRHAEIIFDGAQYVFRDNGSSCGSFINSLKMDEKVLRDGDTIRLGRKDASEISFRCAVGQPAEDSPAGEPPPRVMTVIDETQTRFLNTSLLKQLGTGAQTPVPTFQRLSALYEVSSAMLSIKDFGEVSKKLLDLVFANVACERAIVMLYDAPTATLAPETSRSTVDESDSFNPSRTITDRAYEENVALLSVDAGSDARFAKGESILLQAIRSVMCAPIASANRVWGVIYVDTITSKTVFEQEDLEFLLAITRQAGMAMESLFLVGEQGKTIESFVRALAASIDARDDLTAGHSGRVGRYSSNIAKYMGWSAEERKRLAFAGLLHDYGKIGTREAILCKPGTLTPEEYEHVKEHASHTMRILSRIHFTEDLQDLPLIAASHHERMDGKGYPLGLKGDEIPLGSRIISVADFFDALTRRRHYREPMPVEEVIQLIRDQVGTAFDPEVVGAFEQWVNKEYIPSQRKAAARDADASVDDVSPEIFDAMMDE
jgi:HD-GYP domain-containing protein (c-di-GMP phosphodiesterase class II)/pSer/pThr/pTyr-binding forkhead associated (FHA) protein